MIITFCGHSNFTKDETLQSRIVAYLSRIVKNSEVIFYLGNYGAFDFLAETCCLEIKKDYPTVKVIFVTTYQNDIYLKSKTRYHNFDEIIYPEIEQVPKRYAIVSRNKYMIDSADIVITYVNTHIASNSYKMLKYAKSKNKTVVNFAEITS